MTSLNLTNGSLILASLVSLFFSSCTYSLQGPFFPGVATAKGLSAFQYSIVFSSFELVSFIASFPIVKLMNILGYKLVTVLSAVLLGLSVILFGWFYYVDDSTGFFLSCLFGRTLEALGNTGLTTGVMTIATDHFPHIATLIIASTEMSYGLGFVFGPLISGPIYDAWGYVAAFVLVGFVILAFAVLLVCVLPRDNEANIKNDFESKAAIGIIDILKVRRLWFGLPVLASSEVSLTMVLTFLEPHLRNFKFSTSEISLIFSVTGLAFATGTVFWGLLCYKYCEPHHAMTTGSILHILGFSFIGPLPFLRTRLTIWKVMIGIFLTGCGMGAQAMPSFFFIKKVRQTFPLFNFANRAIKELAALCTAHLSDHKIYPSWLW